MFATLGSDGSPVSVGRATQLVAQAAQRRGDRVDGHGLSAVATRCDGVRNGDQRTRALGPVRHL